MLRWGNMSRHGSSRKGTVDEGSGAHFADDCEYRRFSDLPSGSVSGGRGKAGITWMEVRVFRYASPSSFLRVLTVPVMSGCVSDQETMTTLFAPASSTEGSVFPLMPPIQKTGKFFGSCCCTLAMSSRPMACLPGLVPVGNKGPNPI